MKCREQRESAPHGGTKHARHCLAGIGKRQKATCSHVPGQWAFEDLKSRVDRWHSGTDVSQCLEDRGTSGTEVALSRSALTTSLTPCIALFVVAGRMLHVQHVEKQVAPLPNSDCTKSSPQSHPLHLHKSPQKCEVRLAEGDFET